MVASISAFPYLSESNKFHSVRERKREIEKDKKKKIRFFTEFTFMLSFRDYVICVTSKKKAYFKIAISASRI